MYEPHPNRAPSGRWAALRGVSRTKGYVGGLISMDHPRRDTRVAGPHDFRRGLGWAEEDHTTSVVGSDGMKKTARLPSWARMRQDRAIYEPRAQARRPRRVSQRRRSARAEGSYPPGRVIHNRELIRAGSVLTRAPGWVSLCHPWLSVPSPPLLPRPSPGTTRSRGVSRG